jgi:hypothetical protein
MTRSRLLVSLAALAIAGLAFALYHATLMPSFDFGDTGFFQTVVGSPSITPRDGYPLYFAIGNLFAWLTNVEPARALNLASAVEGALACGLLVIVAAELSGSVTAGVAASLLFAGSYTFWSQAIIAEVYALHMAFVALTLLLALRWADEPTTARLSLFLGAYALGFGNHLSMILLFPAYTFFILFARAGQWRSMLRPRIVALAVAIAFAGSLQYAWNLRGLWQWPHQPPGLLDALQTLWFDVTKADWRETMVLNVPRSILADRLAMYRFEVIQQFGWASLLAPLGLARLVAVDWRRGVLMLMLYAGNVSFAYTYNVGDTHVFYLPSHLILAMLIAPGIVFAADMITRSASHHGVRAVALIAASCIVIAVAAGRIYHDYPALDRSGDRRPTEVLTNLTKGLDDRHAILLADLNWQLVNGLAYFAKVIRPEVAYTWLSHVLLYAPALIHDNFVIGRDVALTPRARQELMAAYGPLLPTVPDPRVHVPTLVEMVGDLPRGTRYAFCVLRPSHEFTVDAVDLRDAMRILTAGDTPMPDGDYAALAGVVGQPPALAIASSAPFHRSVTVDGVPLEVRMESWLTFDTIRRMGFGQVIAARHHTLIVERGVSLAAFDKGGRALKTGYAANIFAPQARYFVRPSTQLGTVALPKGQP